MRHLHSDGEALCKGPLAAEEGPLDGGPAVDGLCEVAKAEAGLLNDCLRLLPAAELQKLLRSRGRIAAVRKRKGRAGGRQGGGAEVGRVGGRGGGEDGQGQGMRKEGVGGGIGRVAREGRDEEEERKEGQLPPREGQRGTRKEDNCPFTCLPERLHAESRGRFSRQREKLDLNLRRDGGKGRSQEGQNGGGMEWLRSTRWCHVISSSPWQETGEQGTSRALWLVGTISRTAAAAAPSSLSP